MDPERTASESEQPGSTGQAPAAARTCYVESASTLDIMFDQLDYLAAHVNPYCTPKCKDCARLQQVERWLLLPFRPKARRRPSR
jgi:hypothetical protein